MVLKSELRPRARRPRFIVKLANYQGAQERSARAGASFPVEPDQGV